MAAAPALETVGDGFTTGRRGWPRVPRHVQAAAAILIVLSLVSSLALFRQPDEPYRLLFQPSPGDAAQEFNFGGDPGRTWNLGDANPSMAEVTQMPSLDLRDRQFQVVSRDLVVGNSYFQAFSDGQSSELVRFDLRDGARTWSVPATIFSEIASDGELIFAMVYEFTPPSGDQPSTELSRLTAFSIETGEVVWTGPGLPTRGFAVQSIAVTDHTVFALDQLGNAVAVNSSDGSMLWQYPEHFSNPPADQSFILNQNPDIAQISINATHVFINQPSKTVIRLEKETGTVSGAINLVDEFGSDIEYPIIQATDSMLVITAVQARRQTSADQNEDYAPAKVLIFDSNSLAWQSTSQLADYTGNTLVTEHGVFVVTPATPLTSRMVYRIDLSTGDLGSPVGMVRSNHLIFLSASGGVLMATGDPSGIWFIDLETGEQLGQVELGITNMETPFLSPVLMWDERPIVITGAGEVFVVSGDSP
jgi:outer membrane protein assembly factor BamB